MSLPDLDLLTSHVSKIFRIDDVTAGDPREWIVRYRRQLYSEDTVAAYDQLAEAVRPHGLTQLFRKGDDGRQIIFLSKMPGISPPSRRVAINVILFVLTFLGMMLTGVDVPPEAVTPDSSILVLFQYLHTGLPFALSMMGILFDPGGPQVVHAAARCRHRRQGAGIDEPEIPGGERGTQAQPGGIKGTAGDGKEVGNSTTYRGHQ